MCHRGGETTEFIYDPDEATDAESTGGSSQRKRAASLLSERLVPLDWTGRANQRLSCFSGRANPNVWTCVSIEASHTSPHHWRECCPTSLDYWLFAELENDDDSLIHGF